MARIMLGPSGVRRRVWMWVAVGLIGFAVLAVVATVAAVPLTSNALRKRMIETLSKRLDAEVALGDLTWRVFPTLHASGSNLTSAGAGTRTRGHSSPSRHSRSTRALRECFASMSRM